MARAAAFRAIAARKNLTLDALARVVGVGERHFYRLLNGRVSPSPRTRASICNALDLPFEALFEMAGDCETADGP